MDQNQFDKFRNIANNYIANGSFVDEDSAIDEPDDYKVDDFEVFVDDDGGDFWTRVDGTWVMLDPVSNEIYETTESWDNLVYQYGPVFIIGEIS